jgi:DNA replication protein
MPDRQLSRSYRQPGFVSLPESFFTQMVPKIKDLAELKIVLYVAYITLQRQDPSTRRSECSVTYEELKSEICRLSAELDEEALRQALHSAVKHGALLRSTSDMNGALQDVYSLAAPAYRARQAPAINIYALYEQNIGIITPMMAEKLKDAERIYPLQWIEEAIEIAVTLNKRNWGYIARILERWASEGKDSGEYKRNIKKDDPDKYIRGKYGHLVKR